MMLGNSLVVLSLSGLGLSSDVLPESSEWYLKLVQVASVCLLPKALELGNIGSSLPAELISASNHGELVRLYTKSFMSCYWRAEKSFAFNLELTFFLRINKQHIRHHDQFSLLRLHMCAMDPKSYHQSITKLLHSGVMTHLQD